LPTCREDGRLAVELLQHHKIAQAEEWLKNGGGWNPDHLVFCAGTGTAFAASNWHREYYRPWSVRLGYPTSGRMTSGILLRRCCSLMVFLPLS
jgi:hypothetical protein